jgi:hypothetical protein
MFKVWLITSRYNSGMRSEIIVFSSKEEADAAVINVLQFKKENESKNNAADPNKCSSY